MSASTRGLTPVLPLGLQATPPAMAPCAVVLRLAGLRLEAEAVGERPAPRLGQLQQHRLVGFAAGGILDRRIHLVEQREVVEIALRVEQRRLVQRVAGWRVMARATVSGRVNAAR